MARNVSRSTNVVRRIVHDHELELGVSTSPGSSASSPRPPAPLQRISAPSAAPGHQRSSVSSLGYETATAAAPVDYGVDDPSLLPKQPGKPPPLITRYR
uniref:Uncharacterized protein n=1 Tax=Triticum urartu TaxID=4572 RepID=A0A8R7UBB3_TRIUA